VSRPRFTYRVECGACGHRRAWLTATAYMPDGRIAGRVTPNSPGGPLDHACPECGTTDPQMVRRCWIKAGPELNIDLLWRYVGAEPPRQPFPTGLWPEPVALADVVYPDPHRADEHDPLAGPIAPVGQQLAIGVLS
jgi:hypothetical protein